MTDGVRWANHASRRVARRTKFRLVPVVLFLFDFCLVCLVRFFFSLLCCACRFAFRFAPPLFLLLSRSLLCDRSPCTLAHTQSNNNMSAAAGSSNRAAAATTTAAAARASKRKRGESADGDEGDATTIKKSLVQPTMERFSRR